MKQIKQLIATFNVVRANDPKMVPIMVGGVLAALLVFLLLGLFVGPLWLWLPLGILVAVLVAAIVLGRRAQSYQLASIEGQPGAAAAVLQSMRGAWEVTPAISVNRRQDMIHLAVGPPGVVLVGEGDSPARLKQMMAKERRRIERAAGDTTVTPVLVGHGNDQVELQRLTVHLTKLKREIKSKEVGPLHRKLEALKSTDLPMPKGPQMRRAPKKYR
ncbi:DUF4191 domain-containing protein [Euzebya tangerina]|uniref:DUF4191 domain-containing protein n=1 Tax=Euzebya tangerina TaxID=591198 RepID=UPI000E312ACF|nr:DUF4191 domain-containing protein [Euzebya tangerina]